MLLSMTGFSSKTLTIPLKEKNQVHGMALLKSLNSRFFEVTCKLPYALSHLETDITKRLKEKLIRGSIFFTVHLNNPGALKGIIEPSLGTLESYIQSIKTIQQKFKIEGTLSINELITLPNVFDTQEEPLDQQATGIIISAVEELIEQLLLVRKQEGTALSQDIVNRFDSIQKNIALIEPRAEEVIKQKRTQIIDNFKAVLAQVSQESLADQCSAIFNQLERIDIHEEIIRFKSHLSSIRSVLTSASIEKGKKLDFILQELFREINTMTAKCADSILSSLAINIKVELEKAREQVQNIV